MLITKLDEECTKNQVFGKQFFLRKSEFFPKMKVWVEWSKYESAS